jgi:dephospho-CoA kinase
MLFVGLTGGLGSGKSTVSGMLAARGAVVLDADVFAREAIAPGTPGYDEVLRVFGPGVERPDGELDRGALARVVFADAERRRALEAIVHPEVRRRVMEQVQAHAGSDRVVVLDSPLLIETGGHEAVEVLVVVSASTPTQVARSVARGMDEADAIARIEAQMPLERKAEVADVILDNDGSLEDLERQVDRLWERLCVRAGQGGGPEEPSVSFPP